MGIDSLGATVRVFVLVAAVPLLAPACSSRPIAGDGGDAASAGTGGGGGASGSVGRGGAGGDGTAGTTGAAGSVGSGGTTGTAGTGGSSGTTGGGRGGSSGTTGAAGSGGTTGSGGRGGSAGNAAGGRGGSSGGASGGSGGGASGGRGGASGGKGGAGGAPGPECTTASDCMLVNDCCSCMAVPVGTTVATCPAVCVQSACDARQLPRNAVACVVGRCVAGFACDTSGVTCRMAPPTCPAGEVPTVNAAGNCYVGTCAPATQCTRVDSCLACTSTTESCVSYQTQLGTQHHCVTIPPACNGNGGCACVGLMSCLAPYRTCAEYSGIRGVICSCPTC